MNMNLFSLHYLTSDNTASFFVILAICHFLQINALNDNIFIWNLGEILSVVHRMKQTCSFYSNTYL